MLAHSGEVADGPQTVGAHEEVEAGGQVNQERCGQDEGDLERRLDGGAQLAAKQGGAARSAAARLAAAKHDLQCAVPQRQRHHGQHVIRIGHGEVGEPQRALALKGVVTQQHGVPRAQHARHRNGHLHQRHGEGAPGVAVRFCQRGADARLRGHDKRKPRRRRGLGR